MDLEGEPKTTPSIPTGFRVTQQFRTHVAVRPGPATSFQLKFERAGPQVAPTLVAGKLVQLPSTAQFGLILLSRQRRDDVLNDLYDWADHDGRFNAKCWLRLTSAFFGQVLDVLYRIGEVVGKFRGAK